MLIVGENLKSLIEQHKLISDPKGFDESSLSLTLARDLVLYEPQEDSIITYGNKIPGEWTKSLQMTDEGFVLSPKSCVLGCSRETITMPLGYFGLLQTKGTLARLFTTVHCCDGQVDPGFSGKITFEIVNLAGFKIRFLPNQNVAQLFIFKASTTSVKAYNGRYQGAQKPTISISED